nr:helix-turn-helix domain-containing protein [uncultured Rhodopila sp.]
MTGVPRIPVLVVLPPRVLLLDVAGPIEVLRIANRVQDKVAFDVGFAAPAPVIGCSIGLSLSGAGPLPDRLDPGTMVLVSGSAAVPFGPLRDAAADKQAEDVIVAWLRQAIRPGITLISICEGALLAARAGLLDGYACTTHHACCERLAALAPAAKVLENRLFVEDRDRLSSAGVTAGIDLMLHLVAARADAAAALAVARALVVYLRRGPDDPQLSAWLEGRNHLHPAVHRAQDALAAEPARQWSLEGLAREAHLSPRHLSRLFPLHAGMTVTDAVTRARVAVARDLLSQTRLDMESVAERAGFGSARHMRRVWRRFYPAPPLAIRRV